VGGDGLTKDTTLTPKEEVGFASVLMSEHCIDTTLQDLGGAMSITQGATGDILFTVRGCRAIRRYAPRIRAAEDAADPEDDSPTEAYSIWWSAPIGTAAGRHEIPGSTEDPLYWPTHLTAGGPDLLVTDPLGCRVARLVTGQRPGPDEA